MKVGLYQFSPVFGEVKTNLDRVASQIEAIECDLLVLPEFAMTGYQFISKDEIMSLAEPVPDGPTTIRLSELARSRNMYVVAGLPERRGNQLFNSAVLVGPQGFLGVYRHRLPDLLVCPCLALRQPALGHGDQILHGW